MSVTQKVVSILKDPKTSVETITPAIAEKWLEANTNNRPVRQQHVDFLASEMKAGAWKLTSQGIAFADNGALLDGQHRLWAIVLSGVTVKMNVTRGLGKDAQEAIDVNIASRSVGDVLSLGGAKQGKKRAEIINLIRLVMFQGRGKIGVQEARAINDGTFSAGIEWALVLPERKSTGITAVRGSLAIAYATNPEKVASFADQVWHGLGLKQSDPAYQLRAMLLGETEARARMRSSYDRRAIALKTLRAAMAFINGEPLRALYVTEDSVAFFAQKHGVTIKSKKTAPGVVIRQSKLRGKRAANQ